MKRKEQEAKKNERQELEMSRRNASVEITSSTANGLPILNIRGFPESLATWVSSESRTCDRMEIVLDYATNEQMANSLNQLHPTMRGAVAISMDHFLPNTDEHKAATEIRDHYRRWIGPSSWPHDNNRSCPWKDTVFVTLIRLWLQMFQHVAYCTQLDGEDSTKRWVSISVTEFIKRHKVEHYGRVDVHSST